MDHKELLQRLDQIERLICDLRLVIIDDVRGTLTPRMAREIMKLQVVDDKKDPPPEIPEDKRKALEAGIKAGVFSDPHG